MRLQHAINPSINHTHESDSESETYLHSRCSTSAWSVTTGDAEGWTSSRSIRVETAATISSPGLLLLLLLLLLHAMRCDAMRRGQVTHLSLILGGWGSHMGVGDSLPIHREVRGLRGWGAGMGGTQ